MIFLLVIVIFILIAMFIVGITIQGKMSGGLTRTQAWKELVNEFNPLIKGR